MVDHAMVLPDRHQKRPYSITQPITRTTSAITEAPRFKHTVIQGQIFGLKANVNGEWMLTLRVPSDCFEGIHLLNGAFGLELDLDITRRPIKRSTDA